jgi:hypothetical protein
MKSVDDKVRNREKEEEEEKRKGGESQCSYWTAAHKMIPPDLIFSPTAPYGERC